MTDLLLPDDRPPLSFEARRDRLIVEVNLIRDHKIAGGFDFDHGGETWRIQSRQSDRENVLGLAISANAAIDAGAEPGDLTWLNPLADFAFIAEDNSAFSLDAFGMRDLYRTGLAFKSLHTLHARAMKDAALACETVEQIDALDFTLAETWP